MYGIHHLKNWRGGLSCASGEDDAMYLSPLSDTVPVERKFLFVQAKSRVGLEREQIGALIQ